MEEYKNQVFYQLAVLKAISEPNTITLLRQKPDRLEPLNKVLYAPARRWEADVADFVPRNQLDAKAEQDLFYAPLYRLLEYLRFPSTLWRSIEGEDALPLSHVLRRDMELLKANLEGLAPMLLLDSRVPQDRYVWTVGFRNWSERPVAGERAARTPQEDISERAAIDAVSRTLGILSDSKLSLESLVSRNITPAARTAHWLLDYTFPADVAWDKPGDPRNRRSRERDTSALYHALLESSNEIRGVLQAACLQLSSGRPAIDQTVLSGIIADASRESSDIETFRNRLAETVDASLAARPALTGEVRHAVDAVTQMNAFDFDSWCAEIEFLARRLRRL